MFCVSSRRQSSDIKILKIINHITPAEKEWNTQDSTNENEIHRSIHTTSLNEKNPRTQDINAILSESGLLQENQFSPVFLLLP